jgi:hypothetical protein
MNLSSFVDISQSYDLFYTLLDHLFSFYNNQARTDMSVFIVSGNSGSGKKTMLRLIRSMIVLGRVHTRGGILVYRKGAIPLCHCVSGNKLHEYANNKIYRNRLSIYFDRDIILCNDFSESAISFDQLKTSINKLHKKLVAYETIHCCTLIVNVKCQGPLPIDTNNDSKRNVKQFYLSNNFKNRDKNIASDIVLECLKEMHAIIDVFVCLKEWQKFSMLRLSEDFSNIIGELFVDISCHWYSLVMGDVSEISRDWWKIILGYKNIQNVQLLY